MEDLAVFTALNHLSSFGKNLVKLKKINKYIIYWLRVGLYDEKPSMGPPSQQITLINVDFDLLIPIFSSIQY